MAKRKSAPRAKKTKNKFTIQDSLIKGKNPRVRSEFIDFDYVKTLSPEDQEYLAKFNSEYYGASVGYNEKTGRAKSGQLHKKKTQIKEIFDANNRRNNDVLGVTKANLLLSDIANMNEELRVKNAELTEEATVAFYDDEERDIFLTREEFEALREQLTMEMQMFYESYYNSK